MAIVPFSSSLDVKRPPTRDLRVALALLLLACPLYLWWWSSAPLIDIDSAQYQGVAVDLADGSLDDLHYRAPGYPLLLWLTGAVERPSRALFVVSLILHGATLLASVVAFGRIDLPAATGPLFVLIALLPPFIEPSAYVMTEGLTACLLLGLLWVLGTFTSSWTAALAGVLVGTVTLVRPAYQLLGVMLALVLFFAGARRRAAALLMASLIVVVGYSAWNLSRFGYFGVTPALGWNLTTKTALFVERVGDPRLRELLVEMRDRHLVQEQSHMAGMFIWSVDRQRLSEITGFHGTALDRHMVRLNVELIRSAPLSYLAAVMSSLAVYWLPGTTELAHAESRVWQLVWAAGHFALTGLFWLQLVAVVGTWLTSGASLIQGPSRRVYSLALTIILYTMVVSCFIEVGNPRYRVPTDLLILLTTIIGVRAWNTHTKAMRSQGSRQPVSPIYRSATGLPNSRSAAS